MVAVTDFRHSQSKEIRTVSHVSNIVHIAYMSRHFSVASMNSMREQSRAERVFDYGFEFTRQ